MALEYAKKIDYFFYRRKDYYSYKRKEIEEMKENCLIINNKNYNYLRLVFVEIPKVY